MVEGEAVAPSLSASFHLVLTLCSLVSMVTLLTMCVCCKRPMKRRPEDLEEAYGVINPDDVRSSPRGINFRLANNNNRTSDRQTHPNNKSGPLTVAGGRSSAPLNPRSLPDLPQLPTGDIYTMVDKRGKRAPQAMDEMVYMDAEGNAATYDTIDMDSDSVDGPYSKVDPRANRKYDYPQFNRDGTKGKTNGHASYQSASQLYNAGSEDPYSSILSETRNAPVNDDSSAYEGGYARVRPGGSTQQRTDSVDENTERELDQLYSKIRRPVPSGPSTEDPSRLLPPDEQSVNDEQSVASRDPSYRYVTVRECGDALRERLRREGQLPEESGGPARREHYYSTIQNVYESVDSASSTGGGAAPDTSGPTASRGADALRVSTGETLPPLPPTSPIPGRSPHSPTNRVSSSVSPQRDPFSSQHPTSSRNVTSFPVVDRRTPDSHVTSFPVDGRSPDSHVTTVPVDRRSPDSRVTSSYPADRQTPDNDRSFRTESARPFRATPEREKVGGVNPNQLYTTINKKARSSSPQLPGRSRHAVVSKPADDGFSGAPVVRRGDRDSAEQSHSATQTPTRPTVIQLNQKKSGDGELILNRRIVEEREVIESRSMTSSTHSGVSSEDDNDNRTDRPFQKDAVYNVPIHRVDAQPGPSSPPPECRSSRSALPVPTNGDQMQRLSAKSKQRRQESIEREEREEKQRNDRSGLTPRVPDSRNSSRSPRMRREEDERMRLKLGTIYTANDYVSPIDLGTNRGWPFVAPSSPVSMRKEDPDATPRNNNVSGVPSHETGIFTYDLSSSEESLIRKQFSGHRTTSAIPMRGSTGDGHLEGCAQKGKNGLGGGDEEELECFCHGRSPRDKVYESNKREMEKIAWGMPNH